MAERTEVYPEFKGVELNVQPAKVKKMTRK